MHEQKPTIKKSLDAKLTKNELASSTTRKPKPGLNHNTKPALPNNSSNRESLTGISKLNAYLNTGSAKTTKPPQTQLYQAKTAETQAIKLVKSMSIQDSIPSNSSPIRRLSEPLINTIKSVSKCENKLVFADNSSLKYSFQKKMNQTINNDLVIGNQLEVRRKKLKSNSFISNLEASSNTSILQSQSINSLKLKEEISFSSSLFDNFVSIVLMNDHDSLGNLLIVYLLIFFL